MINLNTLFHWLFVICLIIGILCAIAAVTLFFTLKIPKVIGQLTGHTARKEIAALNAANAVATGALTGRTGAVPKPETHSANKKAMPALNYDRTIPLGKRQEETYRRMQNETGVGDTAKGLKAENLKAVDIDGSKETVILKREHSTGYGETAALNTNPSTGYGETEVLQTDRTGGYGETEVLKSENEEEAWAETRILKRDEDTEGSEETVLLSKTRKVRSTEADTESITEDLNRVRFEITEEIILIHTEEWVK